MTWIESLVDFAHSGLSESAIDLLYGRGVSDEQIATYRIGYLRGPLPELPLEAAPFLEWSRNGTLLQNVFVFPLTNTLGSIRGVQIRSADREKKGYKDYFLSQDEPVLFGLSQAMPSVWESESIWLVEGVYDLFPIQRSYPPVVATLTAKVSASVVFLLKRLVRKIWLGYDSDAAGQRLAREFKREYGNDFEITIVQYPRVPLPGGSFVKDPGDLWEACGESKVQEFVQSITRSIF